MGPSLSSALCLANDFEMNKSVQRFADHGSERKIGDGQLLREL